MKKLNRLLVFVGAMLLITGSAAFAGVVFEDNFDDGDNDGWFHAGQTYWGSNPTLVNTDFRLEWTGWQMAVVDAPQAQDFVLDVDAWNNSQSAILLLKYIDDSNWMGYYLHAGDIYWNAVVGGAWDWQPRFAAPGLGNELHLRGEVSGGLAKFMVTDGTTTYTDQHSIPSKFLGGPSHFGLISNVGGQFDNVVVTVPDVAGTVTGKVTNSRNGNPVEGAAVRIVGTSNATTTNASGDYTLTGVIVGSRVLEVSATHYVTKQVAIEVAEGSNLVNVEIDPYQQIGEAKTLGPGVSVGVVGIVVAVFSDYNAFLMESEDRSAGITVIPLDPRDLEIGEEVRVVGSIRADGKLLMVGAAERTGRQDVGIEPIGVNNRDIAGAVGNPGLSNQDLLVSAWGRVLATPGGAPVTRRFHITDGSASAGGPTLTVMDPAPLFSDNFNAERNPAWVDYAGTGTIAVVDGRLVATGGHVETAVSGLITGDVQVDVDGVGNAPLFVMIRYQDSDTMVMPLYHNAWPAMQLYYIQGGQWYTTAEAVYTGFDPNSPVPIHGTARFEGTVVTWSITDGVDTWTQSYDFSAEILAGLVPSSGLVGLYANPGQLHDNFVVTPPGSGATSVPADSVQVVIPPSVTGIPTISVDDYVKVVGIAGKGAALDGSIRGITIRESGDLSEVAP